MELRVIMKNSSDVQIPLHYPMTDCSGAFLRSAKIHSASGDISSVFVTIDELQNPRSDLIQADAGQQTIARRAFAVIHDGSFEYNGYNHQPVTFPSTNVTRLHIRLYEADGITPVTMDPTRVSLLNIYLG